MSCSPRQETSASPLASSIPPWLRSARRIARSPLKLFVRSSTKRRPSSPALACACASPCVRHHVSGSHSLALRSTAALPPELPRSPDQRLNGTFCTPCVRRCEVSQRCEREFDRQR